MSEHRKFILASKNIAFDTEHRRKIKFNISQYSNAFERGMNNYSNIENGKNLISAIKGYSLENLPDLLDEFEKNAVRNGIKVIWATDGREAKKKIEEIFNQHNIKLVVKSKSMISEELHLNQFLEKKHISPIETDLGEYIVQLAGEPPYHILTPAMHKSKEDVAALFYKEFGLDKKSTPEQITQFVRNELRQKFTNAGAAITGANFLIADAGAIALTENEGNGIMSLAFPKVHIALAGIEKIIPQMNDLGKIWPVLAQFGTGQNITVYNSIISGPGKDNELDGPENMYVILLDNGRSKLNRIKPQREALKCIRCGACLNVCPVYKNVGGHTFNTAYPGPIGSVITPFLRGAKFDHLAFACSLCGKCTEICPAKIQLHHLLLYNRDRSNRKKPISFWNGFVKTFTFITTRRKMMDLFNSQFKNVIFKTIKNGWGNQREVPVFKDKSFSKQWNSISKEL
jgi:L-lactate dehydrogenase complex protein LldF